ncbi:MAG TPA: hypothetical protein VLV87_08505 [Gammaproteobacteria bacterium]|nr:hypothetical protein [Gammaproteobacteria bacterium]
MHEKHIAVVVAGAAVLALTGCSSIQNAMGGLTVKDYTAKTGQRVMAGQAEPKSDYGCAMVSQEKQDFGLSGNMDRAAAIEHITQVAVDTAPSKGANYAYVIIPSETSVGGFNTSAFKDAQVAYYKCASLPSP